MNNKFRILTLLSLLFLTPTLAYASPVIAYSNSNEIVNFSSVGAETYTVVTKWSSGWS